MHESRNSNIAIIGGGPSALMMFKRFIESGLPNLNITIFEKNKDLGRGMPYSIDGANNEHVTNVSDNEIPEIVSHMQEWVKSAPQNVLDKFNIKRNSFNEYQVLPRLLFGEYLSSQFKLLLRSAKKSGINVTVRQKEEVVDMVDDAINRTVSVVTKSGHTEVFDRAIICTGHLWPVKTELKFTRYFESPYPPRKLKGRTPFAVALKGSSLTAIDALRTLARENGHYTKNIDETLTYHLDQESEGFEIVMHSIGGMLPAVRFHLDDTHLSTAGVMTDQEMQQVKNDNGGFIPLDYLFETHFKEPLREKDPAFFSRVKDMKMEEFVAEAMRIREELDPFVLLKAEYREAEKSIKKRESVYWKEMLGSLSFAMNYPAKHFSAEDMLRLKKTLMPLISLVIAYIPQSSCRELMALHDAGLLNLVTVDADSKVTPHKDGGATYEYTNTHGEAQAIHYPMFIDCVGQPQFMFEEFSFKSLIENGTLSPARLQFRSAVAAEAAHRESGKYHIERAKNGDYYMKVPGININDNFQVLDSYNAANDRIYIMAVPFIGGLNPDYSGLDFCEEASGRIVSYIAHLSMLSSLK